MLPAPRAARSPACPLSAVPSRPANFRSHAEKEDEMSIAKVSEISSTSSKGFQDAIEQGIARANKTLRHVRSAWVKEQQIRVTEGAISEYQVNLMVTFVVDD
jgi:flavin-binding protein dodecin